MVKSGATAIGIDLGTTNSCVAVIREKRVEIIFNEMGQRTTLSFIMFTEDICHIEDPAKAHAITNPENTIFDAKWCIGRQFSDPEIQKRLKFWPFKVLNASGNPMFRVTYKGEVKELTPEEISAIVLSKMKAIAETYIGATVKDAVITVPAYFNDSQRQATLDAGKIAGLNVLKLLNEPTAAAIAYGLDRKVKSEQNVLVFDFKESTFDVAILSLSANNFDVLAVDGDTCLGGGDFDECLVEHFLQEIRTKHGKDLSGNSKALGKLRKACERAMRNLSSSKKEPILVESLFDGNDFKSSLTRSKLNELCSEHFKKTMKPVDAVLRSAKMDIHDIDEIILAGGSTRIPKIQELLKEKFKNRQLNQTINPDEVIAYGAAIHAANLSDEKSVEDVHFVDDPICIRVANSLDDLKRSLKLEPALTLADGHCLLHAVTTQLASQQISQWNYLSLKKAIKTESTTNKDEYEKFVDDDSGNFELLINEYIDEKDFNHAVIRTIASSSVTA